MTQELSVLYKVVQAEQTPSPDSTQSTTRYYSRTFLPTGEVTAKWLDPSEISECWLKAAQTIVLPLGLTIQEVQLI